MTSTSVWLTGSPFSHPATSNIDEAIAPPPTQASATSAPGDLSLARTRPAAAGQPRPACRSRGAGRRRGGRRRCRPAGRRRAGPGPRRTTGRPRPSSRTRGPPASTASWTRTRRRAGRRRRRPGPRSVPAHISSAAQRDAIVVMSGQYSVSSVGPVPCPRLWMRTGRFRRSAARSARVRMMATAPSTGMSQSRIRSGLATTSEARYSSMVSGWPCQTARGLSWACSRQVSTTAPRCSSVVPYSWAWRWAHRA